MNFKFLSGKDEIKWAGPDGEFFPFSSLTDHQLMLILMLTRHNTLDFSNNGLSASEWADVVNEEFINRERKK